MRFICFICIIFLLFGDTARHAGAINRRQRKKKKRGGQRRFENIAESSESENSEQPQQESDAEHGKDNEDGSNADLAVRGGRGRRRRRQIGVRTRRNQRESRRRIRSNSSSSDTNQTLIWKCGSIKGTLFNHFMQVKYIYSVAQQYNRSLVIVSTTGRASDAKDLTLLSLCDAFDFSGYNIVCTTDPKVVPLKCFEKFEVLDRFTGMARLCYDGRIW
jgi:hypothetical protein